MSNLNLIGNSHLDPVWLWDWKEGFSEVLATYRSVLDRMKEFPAIKFASACAVYYQWIEAVDPAMFNEIKEMVACGRWNVVGGWYLQPDCNIPDGESFVRHALISQRYFDEKLGVTAKTGYNVDSFGHNAGLPKILTHCGMENYVFMRPMPDEQGRGEHLFWWESDDGSRVTAFRIPLFYNIDLSRMEVLDEIHRLSDEEKMPFMAFYGIGNHGGGPSIKLIDAINREHLTNAVYSTPDDYFDSLPTGDLPVLQGELQHHARGCYSANAEVKQLNRLCEQNILAAERLCLLAGELTGRAYPAKKLHTCWKNLMFNQFHDILAGCCIKRAYDDARHHFGEILSITEQEINLALQTVAWNIDTLQGEALPAYRSEGPGARWTLWEHEVLGTPIVVFNPHAYPVRQNIQVYAPATKLTDSHGQEIPFQRVRGEQTNGEDKYHTLFEVAVPALGYTVYRLFAQQPAEAPVPPELTVTKTTLENSKLKVVLDRETGDLCQVFDKVRGEMILDAPCRAVLLDESGCDTWAHNAFDLGEEVASFAAPRFAVVESGPVRAAVTVETGCGNSSLKRTYRLNRDSDVLEVKTVVEFHEKHKTLKFTFPLTDESVIAKVPFGTVRRVGYTGEEPMGSWFASGRLCVANDSKHGYDTKDGYVRLTVLRGAIFADHYGHRDEFCDYMDQGTHTFTYQVFPYRSNSEAERQAALLNAPLRYVRGGFHAGSLPEEMCGFETSNDNVIVSAIKQSEEGDTRILRCYDMDGQTTAVSMRLFGKDIAFTLPHHAIRTVDENATVLNGLEQ